MAKQSGEMRRRFCGAAKALGWCALLIASTSGAFFVLVLLDKVFGTGGAVAGAAGLLAAIVAVIGWTDPC